MYTYVIALVLVFYVAQHSLVHPHHTRFTILCMYEHLCANHS